MVAEELPALNDPLIDDVLRSLKLTPDQVLQLTPERVNTLIQRIEDHSKEKVNGRNRVKVDIYFTAVGMVNIPTETEMKAAIEELQRSRKQAITT